jgi:hypothetical protein
LFEFGKEAFDALSLFVGDAIVAMLMLALNRPDTQDSHQSQKS